MPLGIILGVQFVSNAVDKNASKNILNSQNFAIFDLLIKIKGKNKYF